MKEINIIRRYSIVSLLAMVLFGFAFGNLLSRSMEPMILRHAIDDMSHIVHQNVVKHFKAAALIEPKKGKKYKKFSHKMDHLSLAENIKKVKIWNRDMQIVWSDNKDIVGTAAGEGDRHELQKALKGEIVAETSSSGEHEHKHIKDVEANHIMEVYIPIKYDSHDNIHNVFEVYVNVDSIYEQISHHRQTIWFWTISGFSALYIFLFGGYWSASRQIKKQTSEILQSKQDWEETFNTITDMISIHDMNFNILRANKAAEQGLGLPSLESKNTKCYTYFHQSNEPPEHCPGIKCLEKGETTSAEIYEPSLNKNLDVRAIPRFDKDNKLIGFIHDVRDITHIKKAEEEKAKLHEQFLQAQKMNSIGRLAGGIAHDFNNILSVIIGFSDIALNELPENGVVKDHIKTIHEAGEKAAMLTRQLLAFSRKQVLEMKAVSINNTIENMTTMLGRLIPANITFEFNPQIQEQKILADPIQLEQILMNLVVNGRDAMPDGGLLSIETDEVEFQESNLEGNEKVIPGTYVRLSITDTGTGISQEVLDNIFEPFFSTKGIGKGTGMGLSTVYGIVKQHNAHIVVNSEINKGTTFTIYFPVTEEVPEETCEDNPVRDVRGNETVLVVDDEPLILKVIVSLLKPLGYNLLQASSGESALWESDKYQGNIDLLLTDVVMPGINGNELSERLKEKRPGINIIFMSGYTDDVIACHGVLEEGVVLVNKPIKRDILAGRIREVLDRRTDQKGVMSSAHELKGLDILLVDDNENIRQLIQVLLKDHDFRFDTADNGKDALEKFSAGTYDLVLMDMQMPVMDGLTAVREMRKMEREKGEEETRVIAMTGNSSEEDIKECFQAGYSAHLSKPIKKDQLFNAVIANSSPALSTQRDDKEINGEKIVAHVDSDLKDLIPGYLKAMHNDINRIREAVKVKDYETVKMVGHTLKGSGGGYGFGPITDFGIEIEASAKEEDYENIERNTNKLSDYIENVEIVYE
jgi:PAS domain S-box-containing protein